MRSTVSTTSAASEDAVDPRAASATPTPAAASAGASLTPSPTMIVAPRADSRSMAASLSAGSQSASTVSTPTTRPTMSAMSARSPVTSTTRVMPAARNARTIRGASGRIASCSRNAPAGSSSTATKTVSEPSRSARRRTWRTHGGGSSPTIQDGLAEPDPVAADGALQAVAVHLPDVVRHLQGQPAAGAGGDDRAGQDMRRHLVERGGQPQHLVRASNPPAVTTSASTGSALGQGAGLVEQHHLPGGQRSRAPPPLMTTPICAARDSPDMIAIGAASSSGHGVATTSTATARTGSPLTAQATAGQDQRERNEVDGEPIGGAHERRRRGLGLLDQPYHARRTWNPPPPRSRAGRSAAPR